MTQMLGKTQKKLRLLPCVISKSAGLLQTVDDLNKSIHDAIDLYELSLEDDDPELIQTLRRCCHYSRKGCRLGDAAFFTGKQDSNNA